MVPEFNNPPIRLAVLIAFAAAGAAAIDGAPAKPPGDAGRGLQLMIDAQKGNCLICHSAPIAGISVFGDLGPPLAGVADRMSRAEIRLRVIDSRRFNPNTVMPPFHSLSGLRQVTADHRGKPILTAQDVDDVVAYLATLREPTR